MIFCKNDELDQRIFGLESKEPIGSVEMHISWNYNDNHQRQWNIR